jgi:ATP-dependent exoDNAse (exonuclease V) beta subunit
MSQARNHGNAVHGLMEAYLAGEKIKRSSIMPTNKHVFLSIKPFLDKYITDIYGIELPLYSAHLHTAGRTDVVAKWYDRNSIIDFKTSRRPFTDPKDDRILKYNLQATAYAIMVEERYGIEMPQNVIITQALHNPPMIIVKNNHKYRNLVERLFIHQWNKKPKHKELA